MSEGRDGLGRAKPYYPWYRKYVIACWVPLVLFLAARFAVWSWPEMWAGFGLGNPAAMVLVLLPVASTCVMLVVTTGLLLMRVPPRVALIPSLPTLVVASIYIAAFVGW